MVVEVEQWMDIEKWPRVVAVGGGVSLPRVWRVRSVRRVCRVESVCNECVSCATCACHVQRVM